ncbi:hypothetical protein PAPYR_12606 [Paratrimastix pyriformis]|uniref:Uncharacterized protein n=1 Tax=Paratrimastix pyriformis TaxID=342808 RepID=A0ABQ8U6S6_9EUKA|nr:hypothetical protein PAPYR_12606 [Paratrimastix pyriformis]
MTIRERGTFSFSPQSLEMSKTCCQFSFFDLIFTGIQRWKWAVILIWIILFGLSCWFGPQLLNVTSLEFSSPEHTEGHEALMALNRLFPKTALQVPFFFPSLFRSIPLVHYDRQVPGVVYFTSIDNQTSSEDPSFRLDEIQHYLNATLRAWVPPKASPDGRDCIEDIQGYWLMDPRVQPCII